MVWSAISIMISYNSASTIQQSVTSPYQPPNRDHAIKQQSSCVSSAILSNYGCFKTVYFDNIILIEHYRTVT